MRILIVGDVHWNQYCSIVRKQGQTYSQRLHNLIKSVQWAEDYAMFQQADEVVYLGDFFDKAIINSEEISALSKVDFADCNHIIIVGNHEISSADTTRSSAHYFEAMGWTVIDRPTTWNRGTFTAGYLPYITENNRKPLDVYFTTKPDIIFSHNDIKGLQMGQWLSQDGFGVDELEENCYSFIFNGHLHNNMEIGTKIVNVGILTGRDFGEDASKYAHLVYLLDTDKMLFHTEVNPHAFNFYKLDFVDCFKMDKGINVKQVIKGLLPNAVLSIKCKQCDKETISKLLEEIQPAEVRFIIEPELTYIEDTHEEELTVDHYAEFRKFCIENMDNTDILKQELDIICKRD